MVCPRCIMSVQTILEDLNIPFSSVELGKVSMNGELSPTKKRELELALNKVGFELLESDNAVLIAQIKNLIIQQIHYNKDDLKINYSDYLAEKTKHPYNYLSRLFSEIEKNTIERYITKQKIEKIKKLLFNDEKTIEEIAFEMKYSSSAYLSTQFKKETGMTPSEFKKLEHYNFQHLDNI